MRMNGNLADESWPEHLLVVVFSAVLRGSIEIPLTFLVILDPSSWSLFPRNRALRIPVVGALQYFFDQALVSLTERINR